jgi:hypothetical protein
MTEKAESIQKDYAGNTRLINKLSDGLTHSESVLQPPFPTNCLNWVLGHILSRRNTALTLLQAEPIWDEATLALYKSGSAPITNEQDGRHWDDLLADLTESQQRLEAALQASTVEDLARIAETDRGTKPVWEHLEGLHWHETYHMGQLEILRVMALSPRQNEGVL